jgi:hypothetical protein
MIINMLTEHMHRITMVIALPVLLLLTAITDARGPTFGESPIHIYGPHLPPFFIKQPDSRKIYGEFPETLSRMLEGTAFLDRIEYILTAPSYAADEAENDPFGCAISHTGSIASAVLKLAGPIMEGEEMVLVIANDKLFVDGIAVHEGPRSWENLRIAVISDTPSSHYLTNVLRLKRVSQVEAPGVAIDLIIAKMADAWAVRRSVAEWFFDRALNDTGVSVLQTGVQLAAIELACNKSVNQTFIKELSRSIGEQ